MTKVGVSRTVPEVALIGPPRQVAEMIVPGLGVFTLAQSKLPLTACAVAAPAKISPPLNTVALASAQILMYSWWQPLSTGGYPPFGAMARIHKLVILSRPIQRILTAPEPAPLRGLEPWRSTTPNTRAEAEPSAT